MKKILYGLLLSTMLSSSTLDAAKHSTTFYVVALTGSKVHEQPSFTSKVVRRLPLGVGVQAQQIIASKEVKRIGADLTLPGNWIKVTTPAYTGYLFSSDLTTRRPLVKKSHNGMAYIDLLGAKRSSRTEKEKVAAGPNNLTGGYATKDITEYANGTYITTSFDSCFDHEYVFRQLALNEVYHHLISSYAGYEGKILVQPKLVSRKGNIYTFTCDFGDSASQELLLTVQKNGTLIISSYDCT